MIKNIISLTKISASNFYQNINIFDKKNRKFNKKSIYFWLMVILFIAVTYISNEILNVLNEYGQMKVFLNIYFSFAFILMIFQAVLIVTNIFYFSEDIEILMALPIKPIEMLMAKFNTIISMLYTTEIYIMLIPLILYGIKMGFGFEFYPTLIIVLLFLPILIALIIGIINLLIYKMVKFIKNENVIQTITSFLFIFIIVIAEYVFIKISINGENAIENTFLSLNKIAIIMNKGLLVINPLIGILEHQNIFLNLIKILFVYIVGFVIFIYMGNKVYFKTILSRTMQSNRKRTRKVNLEKECNPKSITKAYLLNEWRFLTRNVMFLLQTVFPVFLLLFTICALVIYLKVSVLDVNQEIYSFLNNVSLNIEGVTGILIICQIMFSLSRLSSISVSKEGKNAVFMKYIPMDLQKQYNIKNCFQIIINILVGIITFSLIKYVMPSLSIFYLSIIFIDAMFINIISSNLMLIMDFKKPFLDWTTGYEVMKQNKNNMFPYVISIIMTLLLLYLSNILKSVQLNIGILIVSIILICILIIIKIYVKKQINNGKLFMKIN